MGIVPNQNLRGMPSADMVIITSSAMKSAAETLANHREQGYGLDAVVVTITKCTMSFPWVSWDLCAVRDLMRMLYTEATPEDRPQYLLLLGDASFDPKTGKYRESKHNTNL